MVSANGVGCWLAGGDARGQTGSVIVSWWGVGMYLPVGVMVWNGVGKDNGEPMC